MKKFQLAVFMVCSCKGERNRSSVICEHGEFDDASGACICDTGWRISGPTDTFNFLKGACAQSTCTSDEKCMKSLGFDEYSGDSAQCIVSGWNCYCGWRRAFENAGSGHETPDAKCTGVLYVLSLSGTKLVEAYMSQAWVYIFSLAFFLLPFGQTHARCQHTNPDMFRLLHAAGILTIVRWDYECNGQCESHTNGPYTMFYYNFAWSLYVLDLGLWSYAFVAIMWINFMLCWAIVLWLIVIITLLVAAIAACVGAVCSCGGDQSDCQCCECSSAVNNSSNDSCCCCNIGDHSTDYLVFTNVNTNDVFYSRGPAPDWGSNLRDCRICHICRPIAWLVKYFPMHPPNMWGGLWGYFVLRTHPAQTRCPYEGGNHITDLFSFRSSNDLHSHSDWRQAVYNYLYSFAPDAPPQLPAASRRFSTQSVSTQRQLGANIISQTSPFNRQRDNVFASSFDDYTTDKCWICMGSSEGSEAETSEQWHLWVGCGHMFCSTCSVELLRRRMPCPLCRRASPIIKTGPKFAPLQP